MQSPTLAAVIHLAPLAASDAEWLGTLVAEDSGGANGIPRPASAGACAAWMRGALDQVARGSALLFGVYAGDGRPMGTIRLSRTPRDARRGQLSYWIAPAWRRRGHATASVRLMVEMAFARWGMDAIEAYVRPDNAASAAVLMKNGFVFQHSIEGALVAGASLGGNRGETVRMWEIARALQ